MVQPKNLHSVNKYCEWVILSVCKANDFSFQLLDKNKPMTKEEAKERKKKEAEAKAERERIKEENKKKKAAKEKKNKKKEEL